MNAKESFCKIDAKHGDFSRGICRSAFNKPPKAPAFFLYGLYVCFWQSQRHRFFQKLLPLQAIKGNLGIFHCLIDAGQIAAKRRAVLDLFIGIQMVLLVVKNIEELRCCHSYFFEGIDAFVKF